MSLFISHASADEAIAMEVCALLEGQGVTCWIAPRDVAPGAKWDEAILDAIEASSAVLLILTEAANASPYVSNEINEAFEKKKTIVTFRAAEVLPAKSLKFSLGRSHWIDGFSGRLGEKVGQLAEALSGVAPAPRPPAPLGLWHWIRVALSTATGTVATLTTKRRPVPLRISLAKAVLLAALAAVTAAIAVFAAQSWRRSVESPLLVRFTMVLPPDQPLNRAGDNDLAISPDGSQIVYSAGRRLYLRRLGELEATPISGTDLNTFGPYSPTFSPEGERIAFASAYGGGISTISTSGGAPVQLTGQGNTLSLHWEGDEILFDVVGVGIQRISPAGGRPETLVPVRLPEVAFAPHRVGSVVIFTVATGTGMDRWDRADVVAYSLDTQERTVLVRGASDARYLQTGHLVYAQSGMLMAQPFDAAHLTLTGPAKPIVEGVARSISPATRGGVAHYAISQRGVLAYIPGPPKGGIGHTRVAFVDLAGRFEVLDLPAGDYIHPRISPDGQRLTVATSSNGAIWVYDFATRQPPRRLNFSSQDRYPIWTPDGGYLTFQSDREGDLAIWQQRADGSEQAKRLTRPEASDQHEPQAWSPDGRVLTFNRLRGGEQGVWNIVGPGTTATRLVDDVAAVEKHSTFSPDGHWFAYMSGLSGVFVAPYPLTGAKFLAGALGTRTPVWSRDGTRLFMHTISPNEIIVTDVDTGVMPPRFSTPRALPIKGTIHPQLQRNFDLMPDGRRLVVILPGADVGSDEGRPAQQINIIVNWFEEMKRLVPVN